MKQAVRLTIRDVRARPINVPVDPPLETASGVIATAPLVLIDLVTEKA